MSWLDLIIITFSPSIVAYPRTSLSFEEGKHELWISKISGSMFHHSTCLVVISKTSMKNQREVFKLAKQFEGLSTETKLMVVIAEESQINAKQFSNTQINTLLFKIGSGMWVELF